MILKLKLDQGRISLGLRQILPDPWTEIGEKYKVGDLVKVEVSRLVPFGAFVQLEEGVEAIIPTSELAERRVMKPSDAVNPGDQVEARIIEMRTDERKMTLSIRRVAEAAPGTIPQPYVPEPDFGGGRGADRGGRAARGGERDGRPIVGGEREGGAVSPPRDRPRRERSGGGGGGRGRDTGYSGDSEEDYKEFKNYRANQREETFGTSLADIFGEHFGKELAEAEPEAAGAAEAEATADTTATAEKE